ncbi:MAG TPA: hypothetical protein DIC32_07745 [Acinetobacter radioresistens]|uniref:Uncharacterized protein n=1 Tax=Acinetobacter radioresistens TaxID=40216 RepID=A0A3D3G1X5_ACIRA|nr:hypothetical protein [Acinetobacter radioresistens]
MSNNTTVSGPIEIKDKSVERVAFDLMEKIASLESRRDSNVFANPNPREYYLKLYNQCHTVVNNEGINVNDVLEKD